MDGKRPWPADARWSVSGTRKRQRTLLEDWDIAWICALPTELVAAEAMLDEEHDALPLHTSYGNAYTVDTNTYTLGSIEGHSVVITCLPADQYGTNNAANVVTNLVRTFPSTRLALMVGIGGVVPGSANDIRLGDVVVGTRTMQYDLGKIGTGAEIQRTAIPRTLHHSFGKAITVLRAKHDREPSRVPQILKERFETLPHYGRPIAADRLFLSTYDHPEPSDPSIASGNQVMKNAAERDTAARTLDVVCFEMEAAGIMDIVPCLPIRGICDYADSHKNMDWQRYAAAAAAAYTRELSVLPSADSGTRAVSRVGPSQVHPNQQQVQIQLMETLKFDQMDSRRLTVKKAHIKTCAWFIKHPDYQKCLNKDDLEEHHELLWIRGKPGAGKSTIMKFALSIEGMYRSLLFQLLQGHSQLLSRNEGCPSLDTLKDLFSQAVLALGQLRLTCFIDALDECDEQQIMDMIREFEDLAEEASTDGITLRICFSSRHYPYIVVKRGVEMVLENQPGHTQDMGNYIKSRLRFNNPTPVEDLHAELLEKAAGVFLWLILVVDILNTEYSQGGLALKKRLIELPNNLGALFKDILTRDTKNMEELFLCVIWILCAKRPLRPEEFHHALWFGLFPRGHADPDPPKVGGSDAGENASRCVISFSKGLAEITKSAQPKVQFIHESVRGYLLKAGGLSELWPELGFDWELPSHERLKDCCDAYIRHYLASTSTSEESLRQYPFMEYASQQVLFHADIAAAGISQDQFLVQFPLGKWVGIYNHFEKHKVRRYRPETNPIYIFAEMDCSRLIRSNTSESLQCFSADRYEYPLFAALAHGNSKSVAAILRTSSIVHNGLSIMEGLQHRKDLSYFKGRTPLSWAAHNDRLSMVALILQAGGKVNKPDREEFTPLMRASKQGHEAVVKLLIDHGADVNARSKNEGDERIVQILIDNALHFATNGRNSTGIYRRYDLSLDFYNSNDDCDAAMQPALLNVDQVIAKIVVNGGPDIQPGNHQGHSAVKLASSFGYEEITRLLDDNDANFEPMNTRLPERLLVDGRADINALNRAGYTALHLATFRADPNTRRDGCDSPLFSAISIRREDMVENM
ncbi:hypothetical protein BDP81DRAFT_460453 [Colletotrichum phormii]|uniref:Nucleoside phosphorylase domain-containing protein n=1 Tax=Colletotrichum phormii TaxID=359342 RepID=A0AAI9ZVX3_9PEZI|nr:uncharacterized protein BDP81DRAFT_460453 [Colletotrichum phormii]KAK1637829.1 hypothetical protein BDP81DRAFT_460453 [Colletotrichum phormii]